MTGSNVFTNFPPDSFGRSYEEEIAVPGHPGYARAWSLYSKWASRTGTIPARLAVAERGIAVVSLAPARLALGYERSFQGEQSSMIHLALH